MNARSVQLECTRHPAIALYARMREYRNPVLINKMMVELKLDRPATEALFEDVKRFLALTDSNINLAPPAAVDKGWHVFILFTRDYAQFCKEHLGHFIHHVPEDPFRSITPDDRRAVPHTRKLAKSVFGPLSDNWRSSLARCGSDDKCRACTKCRGCYKEAE